MSARKARERRAAMRARVDERVQLTFAVTRDDERLAARLHRDVIVGLTDLAFVAGGDPLLLEDHFHFEIEEFGFGEHRSRHAIDVVLRPKIDATRDELAPLLFRTF